MATIDEFYGRDIAFKGDFVPKPTGDLETIAGIENVKDALFRRLVVQPGSLVHRPGYGVGIKDFQGRLNTVAAQRELAIRIQDQFPRDPRVLRVVSLTVVASDRAPDLVTITTRVELVGYGEQTFAFVPFGEA